MTRLDRYRIAHKAEKLINDSTIKVIVVTHPNYNQHWLKVKHTNISRFWYLRGKSEDAQLKSFAELVSSKNITTQPKEIYERPQKPR